MRLEDYFDFQRPDDSRLKGTRVGIETILYDYLYQSRTPEEIVQRYRSLTLEMVYATLTYYHHNKEEVGAYLRHWAEHERRMFEEEERSPSPAVIRVKRIL